MRSIGCQRVVAVMLGVLVLTGSAALADDAAPPKPFHKKQFGLSARLALGVRGIATYDNEWCGTTDPEAQNGFAPVCTGRTPLSLDLEGSYGLTPAIELVLELRIGLETDVGTTPSTEGPRPFHIAPGARFFFSDTAKAKLFVQPMLLLDFAGYATGNDFGVRGIEGVWIDLHKNYGLYFFVAETLGFSRWLSASFEGGVGFQGRYP